VVIHAWGQEYTYEVRSVSDNVNPKDTSLLTKHEELPWLTLVTCKGYDEAKDKYLWRTVVRAVQIDVE
jgi:LPXTG-site transpeptidase (sortase) family protein